MVRNILIIFLSVAFLSSSNGIIEAGSCTPIFPATTCSVSEDVTVTATVPDSTATFNGFAPGSSVVTIKDNATPAGTTTTNPAGSFSKTVISTPGLHDFALYFTDTSGRTTPETLFDNVNLPFHIDTPINDIHLPPTIELSRYSIFPGDGVNIFGQAAPGSTVHVVLNGTEIFSATISSSDYSFLLGSGYVIGNNTIYSYLTRSGLANSINSFTQNLNVNNCRRSDLNCDGHVNLTDFSILLYWWDSAGPTGDTNGDGTVGLIDFSIMLFDWTD